MPRHHLIVAAAREREGPRHRPGGQARDRPRQRTRRDQQGSGEHTVTVAGGAVSGRRGGIGGADTRQLAARRIGAWGGALVGRKGVGHRAHVALPDAALHARPVAQRALHQRVQAGALGGIIGRGREPRQVGAMQAVRGGNRFAGAAVLSRGLADPRRSRLMEQPDHQGGRRACGDHQQHEQHDQTAA